MARRFEDAMKALRDRGVRDGPVALETFAALDEHFALETANLEKMRRLVGLSQRALAERTGISQGDLSKILGGKKDPRLSTFRTIYVALKTASTSLLKKANVAAGKRLPVARTKRRSARSDRSK